MKRRPVIVGSLIAKNQKEVYDRFKKIRGAVYTVQLDVMDGKFVRAHSLDFAYRLPEHDSTLEAHLMIKKPLAFIKQKWRSIHTFIIHRETVTDEELLECIKFIRAHKRKVGIAMNPPTQIDAIKPFLKKIDMVLVMTVYPGQYGATFQNHCLEKVRALRKISKRLKIQVDGGVTPATIHRCYAAGANEMVVGSFLQRSNDPEEAIEALKYKINDSKERKK